MTEDRLLTAERQTPERLLIFESLENLTTKCGICNWVFSETKDFTFDDDLNNSTLGDS
jgi:hypothetical protein